MDTLRTNGCTPKSDAHQNDIYRKSHPFGIKHLVSRRFLKNDQNNRIRCSVVNATEPKMMLTLWLSPSKLHPL
jgi:hypothetical protein